MKAYIRLICALAIANAQGFSQGNPKESYSTGLASPIKDSTQKAFYAKGYSFSENDKKVLAINTKGIRNVEDLSEMLTKPFDTDSLKVRALFFWMTQNISYDCSAFHNQSQYSFSYDSAEELERHYRKEAKNTLIRKRGVCSDYANLFYYLCFYAGIKCEKITGFAVDDDKKVSVFFSGKAANHEWNAVMINKKWYLLDVTWASGYTDNGVKKFYREYNHRYYLAEPKEFIYNHFPKDKKWQLLEKPYSAKEFSELVNNKIR